MIEYLYRTLFRLKFLQIEFDQIATFLKRLCEDILDIRFMKTYTRHGGYCTSGNLIYRCRTISFTTNFSFFGLIFCFVLFFRKKADSLHLTFPRQLFVPFFSEPRYFTVFCFFFFLLLKLWKKLPRFSALVSYLEETFAKRWRNRENRKTSCP